MWCMSVSVRKKNDYLCKVKYTAYDEKNTHNIACCLAFG